MWIRRLAEERLLSRGERDIGWRKDPRPRPRHLGDAILVEQSPALVVGSPWGCSVHHRLGEQYDRSRRYGAAVGFQAADGMDQAPRHEGYDGASAPRKLRTPSSALGGGHATALGPVIRSEA